MTEGFITFLLSKVLLMFGSTSCSSLSLSLRDMKKGNMGVVIDVLGSRLRQSLGRPKDLGLTGKDGLVHPSLAVSDH